MSEINATARSNFVSDDGVFNESVYDDGVFNDSVYDDGVFNDSVYDDGVFNDGVYDDVKMPSWEVGLTAVLLSVIVFSTIVGNTFVVISVFTYRPLRIVQNVFIVSLAVADLTVAVLVMPFNVAYAIDGKWTLGLHLCKIWLTCDILCCTASILNLCAIALDRYWAISGPVSYAKKRTLKRVLIMIGLVWITSLAISLPPVLGWNDWPDESENEMSCHLTDQRGFVVYSSVGSFYGPLIFLAIVYTEIFKARRRRLWQRSETLRLKKLAGLTDARLAAVKSAPTGGSQERSVRSMTPFSLGCPSEAESSDVVEDVSQRHKSSPQGKSTGNFLSSFIAEKQRISLTKEHRLLRTLTLIMGTFVVCWLPFFLSYVILPFCPTCPKLSPKVQNTLVWLGYINSTLNPLIYTVFNNDFRASFFRILKGTTH